MASSLAAAVNSRPSLTLSTNSTTTDDSDFDNDDLPFPTPLPRSDFLTPQFDPSSYLSSLGARHQTLEDLRSDLRQRSQVLSQELLELVNARYEDFLSLGSSVSGGGEKAEELRVGLLALRREIAGLKGIVEEGEEEIRELLQERKLVRSEFERGRRLIAFEGRVSGLERRLRITYQPTTNGNARGDEIEEQSDESTGDEDEDEGDDEDTQGTVSIPRLTRRTDELVSLERLRDKVGKTHPFVAAQRHRVMKIRNVLLLDLGAAVKAAKDNSEKTLKLLQLYRRLGADKEAVATLKSVG